MLRRGILKKQLGFSWRGLDLTQQRRDFAEAGVNATIDAVKRGLEPATDIGSARMSFISTSITWPERAAIFLISGRGSCRRFCVDPMLDVIPGRYLSDASKSPRLALRLLLANGNSRRGRLVLTYALRSVATVAIVYRGPAVDSVPGSVHGPGGIRNGS